MPFASDKVGFNTPWKGGFHITFENGYTVSVQFGYGNYCEHHYKFDEVTKRIIDEGAKLDEPSAIHYAGPSKDAEVAAWDSKGNWIRFPGWDDVVKGYMSPDEVLEIFNYVARLPEVK